METQTDDHNKLINFLDSYNDCFYSKDIEKLKKFYDSRIINFDNHKNNDTYNLEQHLILLSDFFKNGKVTESGGMIRVSPEF